MWKEQLTTLIGPENRVGVERSEKWAGALEAWIGCSGETSPLDPALVSLGKGLLEGPLNWIG